MTNTSDLKRALQSVADSDRPATDPLEDLTRARAARTVRTRRRFRLGLAGVTVAAVVGITAGSVLSAQDSPGSPSGDVAASSAAVRLVSAEFDASPYTFDLTPVGWSVQGENPFAVTIAPDDGSASTSPDDFVGKLVILFDTNEPTGKPTVFEGRTIWVQQSDDYVTMATRARTDEPAGIVRIQYPRKAGWDVPSMQAFLASVHVGAGAQHGQG
jgi:hypothetical protein